MKKIFTLLLTFLGMTYANAQCNHTFRMVDSYGDGWNGASVDVTVNGAVVLSAQAPVSGSPAEDVSFSASNGEVIALTNWVTGSWNSEISWDLLDGGGIVIASGLYGDVTGGAGACPSCFPPTSLATTSLTQSSVDLSWVAGATETAWNIEYGAAGFTSGSGTVVPVTSTNYSITGLAASTSYDMYVQADCGASATSSYAGPISITTPCVAFSAPLDEGFENAGALPVCWALGGGENWLFNTSGPNHVGNGGNLSGATTTGNYYAVVDASGNSSAGGSATLTTPTVDVSNLTAAELTFFLISDDEGFGFSSTLTVTANGDTVGSYTGNTAGWEEKTIDLSAYTTTVTIQFAFSEDVSGSAFYDDIAIDDVSVHETPNCLAPSALTTSNVTATSADVSWTAGGTETEWFLIVNGAGTSQTSTSASLTGLMSNTAYTYQVHAICAVGDTSFASQATSFNTSCTVALAPTNETFDAGFSNCWSQETADSLDWTVDAGGTPSGGTGPSDDFTGITTGTSGNYMYIETSLPVAYGDVATMYSEVIDISGLTNPELRFLNHMYGDAQGTLTVDLWDATAGTVTGTVFTHSGDRGNQWNEELIMLTTSASLIQFSITATVDTNSGGQAWTGDMAIDEFGVREAAANDLALVAAAVASGCDLTATEPIELWVVNQGLVAESAFDLSYAVNGGTPVVESITSTLNPGDTLKHVFTATADMTADGVYDLDFACILATDNDLADNTMMLSAENYYTPMATTTMGDTICNGDTAMVSSDDYSYWYDAATGGNLVGEGDEIDVNPSATTSYYAEAVAYEGHEEDFDSYTSGDFIVASDPNNWAVWPGGGAAVDMPISDVQGNGGNSLRVDNADGTDVVLEFGEAFSTGLFYYSMDVYCIGDGYINFQEQVTIGAAWNMSITFIGGVINVDVDGASLLTGAYQVSPTGGPVWNTIEFECDYSTGTWEVFANGTSQGTFVNPDPVASVNVYPGAGVNYYLDNVEWGALKGDACRSATRTEAVVTVEDCSNILEFAKGNLDVYPNPNNGSFTVENSVDIVKLTITDIHGKIVQSISEINLNKVDVDLTDLEKGMYMINIETKKGTLTESVIVQ